MSLLSVLILVLYFLSPKQIVESAPILDREILFGSVKVVRTIYANFVEPTTEELKSLKDNNRVYGKVVKEAKERLPKNGTITNFEMVANSSDAIQKVRDRMKSYMKQRKQKMLVLIVTFVVMGLALLLFVIAMAIHFATQSSEDESISRGRDETDIGPVRAASSNLQPPPHLVGPIPEEDEENFGDNEINEQEIDEIQDEEEQEQRADGEENEEKGFEVAEYYYWVDEPVDDIYEELPCEPVEIPENGSPYHCRTCRCAIAWDDNEIELHNAETGESIEGATRESRVETMV